jgi:hypothetical protein
VIATIWGLAALAYGLFLLWYVGLGGKLGADEIERACANVRSIDPGREALMRRVFETDDGREFFMVNLLQLHRLPSGATAVDVLLKYQKPFMAEMIKRAGHPIAMCRAASPAVECWGLDNAEDWDAAVLVRYRSRRDLAAILATPMFRTQHPFKLEAVRKTFAFVGDPARIIVGGPKLVVPLVLLVLALAATLAVR